MLFFSSCGYQVVDVAPFTSTVVMEFVVPKELVTVTTEASEVALVKTLCLAFTNSTYPSSFAVIIPPKIIKRFEFSANLTFLSNHPLDISAMSSNVVTVPYHSGISGCLCA